MICLWCHRDSHRLNSTGSRNITLQQRSCSKQDSQRNSPECGYCFFCMISLLLPSFPDNCINFFLHCSVDGHQDQASRSRGCPGHLMGVQTMDPPAGGASLLTWAILSLSFQRLQPRPLLIHQRTRAGQETYHSSPVVVNHDQNFVQKNCKECSWLSKL